MPQRSSRPRSAHSRRRPHRVAVLALPGANPFELGVATEIFGLPRPELGDLDPLYDFVVCGTGTGAARFGFYDFTPAADLDAVAAADTLVILAVNDHESDVAPRVAAALRHAHDRGARLVSFCGGAFILAATGLLDGRRATTHWQFTDELRTRFPAVEVDPDVLYVEDQPFYTSAGSAAAIDLGLAIVAADHGATIANAVARRLVFAGRRTGGQRQYVAQPPLEPDASPLGAVQDWALAHLADPIDVPTLAARAAMAPSTFHRQFLAHAGQSPHAWLTRRRVAYACELLERTDLPMAAVAAAAGLGSAANLRKVFASAVRQTPTAYRRTFAHHHDQPLRPS